MPLAEYHDVVRAFAPDRSDQSLGNSILKSSQLHVFRSMGRGPFPDYAYIPSPLRDELTLADQYIAWGEDRVYFHDGAGRLRHVPTAWTSAAPPDPFVDISAGRLHFRIQDLLQLAALIARQR